MTVVAETWPGEGRIAEAPLFSSPAPTWSAGRKAERSNKCALEAPLGGGLTSPVCKASIVDSEGESSDVPVDALEVGERRDAEPEGERGFVNGAGW